MSNQTRSYGQQGLSAAPARARAPSNQPAEVTTTEDEVVFDKDENGNVVVKKDGEIIAMQG